MSIEETAVINPESNQELTNTTEPIIEETTAVAEVVQEVAVPSDAPEVAEVPVVEATPEPAPAPAPALTPEEEAARNAMLEKLAILFNEILAAKENNTPIEIEITSRIKGGLRATYGELPLFLPASHFSLKRSPTEEEFQEAIGKKMLAFIHEIQEHGEGRKAVIVSRKQILLNEFWNTIKVGDVVEGRISSISTFGVFLDLGGIEGLIHISRLSQVHIDDPKKVYKKGDKLTAVVINVDQIKNRIALSRKELEDSPWKNLEDEMKPGDMVKGVVRRLTDFGAYIELKPGVDGLLRTSELSWTRRIGKPSEVIKIGEEIDLKVINLSSEKQTVSLSLKRVEENPWTSLAEKYVVNAEYEGTVKQVMPQGMIVAVDEHIDGFMPKSKMKKLSRGQNPDYNIGDKLQIIIADLIPADESLILAPKYTDEEMAEIAANEEKFRAERRPRTENSGNNRGERSDRGDRPQRSGPGGNRDRRDRGDRGDRGDRNDRSSTPVPPNQGISFGDLLSESAKKNFFKE
jgi:ribosomal protein S1